MSLIKIRPIKQKDRLWIDVNAKEGSIGMVAGVQTSTGLSVDTVAIKLVGDEIKQLYQVLKEYYQDDGTD